MVPIIPKNELQMLRYEFNDEEIRSFSNIIHENKPPYPRKVSLQNSFKVDERFFKLLFKDVTEYMKPKGQEEEKF